MKNAVDLSIVIVSYNTQELLLSCLSSLALAQTKQDQWEVIVVDNASSDDSVEAVKEFRAKSLEMRVIQNTENVGFAKANNQGIKAAKGEYILLLNSDTEVHLETIQTVMEYLQTHSDVGVATCSVLLPNGEIDPASHRGFPTPWAAFTYFSKLENLFPRVPLFSGYHLWYRPMRQIHEIDSPSGAFFMVRKKVIDEVGLLDESYFMYAEDIDWSLRIKEKGWKIMFIPQVSILHKKKQSGRGSTDREKKRATDRHFYETMLQFYDKHYRAKYSFIVNVLVSTAIRIKLAMI